MADPKPITLTTVAPSSYSGQEPQPFVAVTNGFVTTASPAFTGTPTAPTASAGTSTTQIATTAFVDGEITAHASADHVTIQSAITDLATVGTLADLAAAQAAINLNVDKINEVLAALRAAGVISA